MKHVFLAMMLIAAGTLFAQPALADGSSQQVGAASTHSVKAVGESAQASGHAVVAGMKLTSAATAVPLGASGAVGHASGQSAKALTKAASADDGPLPIADEVMTAGPPPDQAAQ
ncbi:MAG: hypothetical protein Q9M09_00810 [Mariprofundaceae bacterium]|nr:hypothetical protein [Mariprofundaceae bacterium]